MYKKLTDADFDPGYDRKTKKALKKGLLGGIAGGIIAGPLGAAIGGAAGFSRSYAGDDDIKEVVVKKKIDAEEKETAPESEKPDPAI